MSSSALKYWALGGTRAQNLLYKTTADDAKLMVADFGFAKRESSLSGQTDSLCGTPTYIAPEVRFFPGSFVVPSREARALTICVRQVIEGSRYSKYVDIWAVGVIT